MAKDFWTSEKTDLFIELWESKPCLYDTTKETYHDRNVKKRAREEIAQALGTEESEVISKLKKMKEQFTRERAKGMKLKSGSGTEEVPVSRWMYLPLLSFLIPFANAKSSRSNLETSVQSNDDSVGANDYSDSEIGVGSEYSPSSLETPKSTKRPTNTPRMLSNKQKKEAHELDLLKKTAACMEKAMSGPAPVPIQDDSLLIFGKYVATELKDMNPQQMRMTKLRIQQVIIEAQSQVAFQHLGTSPAQLALPAQSAQESLTGSYAWLPQSQSEMATSQMEYHQL